MVLARILAGLALVLAPLQVTTPTSTSPLTAAERTAIIAALTTDEAASPAPRDDAGLTHAALALARKLAGLRVAPGQVDSLWAISPAPRDLAAEFEAARAQDRLASWLAGLPPASPEYRRLVAAYRTYADMAATGGWALISSGPVPKPGEASDLAEPLRARLAAEGYVIAPAEDARVFDAGLASALSLFQARHGLDADGKLGPQTRDALNVPATVRLEQIEANLERLRWLPRPLPADRLEVDTGWQTATLYRANQPVLTMRAIVGKPSTKTPMFASQLEAVVFNPPWNVPAQISREEILPKAARDPNYWAREGFVRTDHGVQQAPGPRNALGLVKFDLPSPFGVYLHDTPSRSLFTRPARALSHGCMRLEKPQELAAAVLGWAPEAVEAAISAGGSQRTPIPRPVPLFVYYRTVIVDEAGAVSFHADTYGWDRRLTTALDGVAIRAAADRPHVTECSV